MIYCSRKVAASLVLAVVSISTILGLPLAGAQVPAYPPGLVILSPAGALTPSPVVRSSFAISFTVTNFTLVEPGQYEQVNTPPQGHVHVFLDGAYYGLVTSKAPIAFDQIPAGQHTIKMQLVNNDHTALKTDVSKMITLNVKTPSASAVVDLTPITRATTPLYYIAIANIILKIIVIIIVLLKK